LFLCNSEKPSLERFIHRIEQQSMAKSGNKNLEQRVKPSQKAKSSQQNSSARQARKASPTTKQKTSPTEKATAADKKKSVASVKKEKSTAGFERVFEQIYRLVLRIPPGRVMTYGQIARWLDERYSPRLVGWAMHATPKDERNIPWHRVINSRGATSTGRLILHEPDMQRLLLENEGVVFNDKAVCDLSVFQWSPVQRKTKANAPEKAKTNAKTSAKVKSKSKM
jgi:methylated-DNA-protein-cysteine methyltransferase related protein